MLQKKSRYPYYNYSSLSAYFCLWGPDSSFLDPLVARIKSKWPMAPWQKVIMYGPFSLLRVQQWLIHTTAHPAFPWLKMKQTSETRGSVPVCKLPPTQLAERTLTDHWLRSGTWWISCFLKIISHFGATKDHNRNNDDFWSAQQPVRVHRCSIKWRRDNVRAPALQDNTLWFSLQPPQFFKLLIPATVNHFSLAQQ